MNSDTPRTDAVEFRHCPPQPEAMLKKHEDSYALSRDLERDLAECKAEVERLRELLNRSIEIQEEMCTGCRCWHCDDLRMELESIKMTNNSTNTQNTQEDDK